MKKKEIQSLYQKKIKLITKYNKSYYENSSSKISDAEYDELKKEILLLEQNNEFLKSKESPSVVVGHKPSKNFKNRPPLNLP